MRWTSVFAVVVVAGGVALAGAQRKPASQMDGPLFRFTQQPGNYAVGLKVVIQYDLSRTYRPKTNTEGKPTVGKRAPPLRTLVWYPAEKSGRKPTAVESYKKALEKDPEKAEAKEKLKALGAAPAAK